MKLVVDEAGNKLFAVIVNLTPGVHAYKFIVDGEWRHDEMQPLQRDAQGNINNCVSVRVDTPPPDCAPPHAHAAPDCIPPANSTASGNAAACALPTLKHRTPMQRGSTSSVTAQHGRSATRLPSLTRSAAEHSDADTATSSDSIFQDVDARAMAADAGVSPKPAMASNKAMSICVCRRDDEPVYTRARVHEFLRAHKAHELIPESSKVVIVDIDLPMRHALHALYEQSVSSAPLWDSTACMVVGAISASDFIDALTRLRGSVCGGRNPLNEVEMDWHSVREMRAMAANEGRPAKPLVWVLPNDTLADVAAAMHHHDCAAVPVLTSNPFNAQQIGSVVHVARQSDVLARLLWHFRSSLSSLPLLAQPLHALRIGTWSPRSAFAAQLGVCGTDIAPTGATAKHATYWRLASLHAVQHSTSLTTALQVLLSSGVSALPVVDDSGCVVDVYARADIIMLAKHSSYLRLQWEDLTVGQALQLSAPAPALASAMQRTESSGAQHAKQEPLTPRRSGIIGGLSHALSSAAHRSRSLPQPCDTSSPSSHRFATCTRQDTLCAVLMRLATPSVRRVFVVDPYNGVLEGVVSLSDVMCFFLSDT